MKRKQKMPALTAALMLTLLAVSVLTAVRTGAVAEVRVNSGTGAASAVAVAEKIGRLGVRLNVGGEISAFSFSMPTWSVSGVYEADLSVYEWKGSVKKTVSEAPLASKRFTRLQDNATNRVTLPSPLPAGEYLFAIENTVGNVGCWAGEPSGRNCILTYSDGVESRIEPLMTVTFTGGAPEVPFLEVKSVEESYGKAPVYEESGEEMKDLSAYRLDGSLYPANSVMPDTWVFTDGLGRRSLTNAEVGDPREDRTLAIFYWTWHASQGASAKSFNVQKFLDAEEAKGVDLSAIINDYSYAGWPGAGYQNFWDEPIYGYYRTNDEWVLRRHAELLANAGVDVVFTDNTNGTFTWRDSYTPLLETWTTAQKDGVAAPKVSFMLPFAANADSVTQMKALYLDIFREGSFRSLWYWLDGKPMLMAYASGLSAADPLQKEIKSFFTFRANVPGYTDRTSNLKSWGWLSMYPQTVYYSKASQITGGTPEQITVGVAQNHNYVTHQLSAMNGPNTADRTYTSKGYDTRPDALLRGANFEEQFEYALDVDPKVIFVTGWNEWIAGRYEEWCGVKNAFPDEFNAKASRDLEPSRGVLKDHYYYQLVNFVRQYKGVRAIPEPTGMKTVTVGGGAAQWADVGPYFAGYIGNTADRDASGYGGIRYTERSARNDLIGAQIARDTDMIYILVECAEEITPFTDPLWMNVYLDTTGENDGWNSFNYVINRTAPKDGSTALLERFTGKEFETEKVADVKYSVSGRYLEIAVKKSDLGISGNDFTLNFSVTDNVHDASDAGRKSGGKTVYTSFTGDILDFYTSGDVMPGGRFKFSYVSTGENASAGQFGPVGGESETTGGDPESPEKGCSSAAPAAALSAAAAAGAMFAKKKRRRDGSAES